MNTSVFIPELGLQPVFSERGGRWTDGWRAKCTLSPALSLTPQSRGPVSLGFSTLAVHQYHLREVAKPII